MSVAGLAASLALQDSLANLASGINILLTKPFVVGDYITTGSYSGTVEEIRIAYTKLTTPENQVVMIPNRTVTASVITNFSSEGKRRLDLTISASYDAPTELVKEALREAIDVPQVLKDEPISFASPTTARAPSTIPSGSGRPRRSIGTPGLIS